MFGRGQGKGLECKNGLGNNNSAQGRGCRRGLGKRVNKNDQPCQENGKGMGLGGGRGKAHNRIFSNSN